MVHLVRTERVLVTVRTAAPWFPVLVSLEVAIAATDIVAIRALLGSNPVKAALWLKSSAMAYLSSVLLPAGRAAGEAARGALLSSAIGSARAVAIAARMQAYSLVANALTSAGILLVLIVGRRMDPRLVTALAANAVVCAGLGIGIVAIVRSRQLREWYERVLRRRFSVNLWEDRDVQARQAFWAIGACVLGRMIQTVECGVLLFAVGANPSAVDAVSAQGVRLVAGALGDLIPNQLGATEGAYYVFSGVMGLADDPARPVAMGVLMHWVQLSIAAACTLLGALLPSQRSRDEA
jgi:hypothetical protein